MIVLKFGEFIGWDLEKVPSWYLEWIMNNIEDKYVLHSEAEDEYIFRETNGRHI